MPLKHSKHSLSIKNAGMDDLENHFGTGALSS